MQIWKISASPTTIDAFRDNEAFAEALTLGRVANLVRSGLSIGLSYGPLDGSNAERIRSSISLLLSGVIAEALPVLERAGKHFRHLPGYQQKIRPILSDPALAELRQVWLTPLRNKAIFHNDPEVSSLGLVAFMPDEPQSIARGSSDGFLDLYYPLADLVALSYVFSTAVSDLDPATFLAESLGTVVDLARQMCEAIDTLLAEALQAWGFTIDQTDEAAG